MKDLINLIIKSEKILDILESKSFFDWNIQISSFLQKIKNKDELIWSTLRILNTLKYFPVSELILRLKIKLYLILKYKINRVKTNLDILIKLINKKDNMFLSKDLVFSKKSYYFSEELLRWVEELYYLFTKIKNEDEEINEIVDILDSTRVVASQKVVDELKNKLSVFLNNKEKYKIEILN